MAEDQSNNPQSEQDRRRGLVAVPALAAFLAVWHQQEQEAIAAKVTAGLALLWPILSYSNVDATTETWLHAAMLQINHGFEQSAAASAAFVQGTLWAHDPEAEVLPAIPAEFPAAEVETALKVTGPVRIKQLTPGPEADVMAVAEHQSTGAGVTRALDGGRQQVIAQVEAMAARQAEPEPQVEAPTPVVPEGSTPAEQAEAPKAGPTIVEDLTRADELAQRRKQRRAIGYARFTDNKPCYFCAMLASLGAFFLSKDAFKASDKKFTGPGTAKVHDHCRCSLRPVFSKKDDMDPRAKNFLKQWGEAQKKRKTGETDVNAFRREYVQPPDYQLADVLSVDERRNAIEAARSNRDEFIRRGLGDDSPQVKYWSDALRNLEAV
ncbi:Uncharacterised protein [Mycobacteroides abscessus subsp. abscessus]|nr:Uncharacterised protein [Mycobacteroides abscessus subsp. abscessus]